MSHVKASYADTARAGAGAGGKVRTGAGGKVRIGASGKVRTGAGGKVRTGARVGVDETPAWTMEYVPRFEPSEASGMLVALLATIVSVLTGGLINPCVEEEQERVVEDRARKEFGDLPMGPFPNVTAFIDEVMPSSADREKLLDAIQAVKNARTHYNHYVVPFFESLHLQDLKLLTDYEEACEAFIVHAEKKTKPSPSFPSMPRYNEHMITPQQCYQKLVEVGKCDSLSVLVKHVAFIQSILEKIATHFEKDIVNLSQLGHYINVHVEMNKWRAGCSERCKIRGKCPSYHSKYPDGKCSTGYVGYENYHFCLLKVLRVIVNEPSVEIGDNTKITVQHILQSQFGKVRDEYQKLTDVQEYFDELSKLFLTPSQRTLLTTRASAKYWIWTQTKRVEYLRMLMEYKMSREKLLKRMTDTFERDVRFNPDSETDGPLGTEEDMKRKDPCTNSYCRTHVCLCRVLEVVEPSDDDYDSDCYSDSDY
jgi:hypothetical protein